MKNTTPQITWSAKNNSSFLNGSRPAKTIRGAVTAARAYVRGELLGEGTITICEDGQPVRQDEKSIFTGGKWETKAL
jgi:hypothetical protein